MPFNVYLDDIRDGPMIDAYGTKVPDTNWVIVRKIEFIKELLLAGLINDISLDHDLGVDDKAETGYDLCKWMEANAWPKGKIYIHTANPVGRDNMIAVLKRNGKY